MPTDLDNSRRAISELLKSADRAIKDGNLDGALGFIERVFEIEARNVYARAYKERILALKVAAEQDEAAEKKKTPEKPVPDVPPAEKKKSEEKASAVAENRLPPPVARESAPRSKTLHIPHSPAALGAYRTLLIEIWQDGNVSTEEQSQIDSMKETFDITEKEHAEIEREVRIEAYLNAIVRDAPQEW